MTIDECRALLTILAVAHDRQVPDGLAEVWAATLDDIPFELGRTAALELIRTSPYMPKVAELRERAKLIRRAQIDRERRAAPLALPSRYEDDVTRDIRMEHGIAKCRDVLGLIAEQLAKRRETPPTTEEAP